MIALLVYVSHPNKWYHCGGFKTGKAGHAPAHGLSNVLFFRLSFISELKTQNVFISLSIAKYYSPKILKLSQLEYEIGVRRPKKDQGSLPLGPLLYHFLKFPCKLPLNLRNSFLNYFRETVIKLFLKPNIDATDNSFIFWHVIS